MARVLVVGATSTVATVIAQKLANCGDDIFCLARTEAKMSKVTLLLGDSCKGHYCYDFNDTDKATLGVECAVNTMGGIDIALIAHGDLSDQIGSETNFAEAKSTFDTNLLSVVSLLIPIRQQMEKQGSGKIGVITSVAGDRGRPRNYTYGAAKGAISIYLQGMRSVAWGKGLEVYDFKLGPVDTPMSATHEKNFSFSNPEKVASIIVKAFTKKRFEVYVPGYWMLVMYCVRTMPEFLFQRLKFLSAR